MLGMAHPCGTAKSLSYAISRTALSLTTLSYYVSLGVLHMFSLSSILSQEKQTATQILGAGGRGFQDGLSCSLPFRTMYCHTEL